MAGSVEKLIEILPGLIDNICKRIYAGIGPDVPYDLAFWSWF
jgi:hypothetical protein